MKRFLVGLLVLTLCTEYVQAQTTYTSNGSGNFRSISWTPSIPSDFDAIASDVFIIRDGDAVTLASDINIGALEVGQGAAGGTFTLGNDATGRSLTISGNLTVLANSDLQVANNAATHNLTVASDIVHAGSNFNLSAGSDVVNLTLNNTTTSVISGNAIILNDLTVSGGGGVILVAAITVAGDFVVDGSGSDVTTTFNHVFQGDFTLQNGGSFTGTNSTQVFNAGSAQALNLSGGVASFNNLTFDNSTKTVTGGLISTGTFEITGDATWSNTGDTHQLANFEVKNSAGVAVSNGTIRFTGGELRYGDGTGTNGAVDITNDGAFTLGINTNLIFDGACSLERDDQFTVDGDVEITTIGYLVMNGASSTPATGESDAVLNVTGTRTMTIRENGDLFLRGYDNFPTGFTTYTLEKQSLVRYDANFDQLFRSENSADATITFGRLYLSQGNSSTQRTRQLFTGDDDLFVSGQFDLVNGVRFLVSHAATLTFNEDLFMDPGGSPEVDPIFSAQQSTIILDATTNQTVDGPVDGNYDVDEWRITNTFTPTTARTVNIDDDISVDAAFSIQNPNGTVANILIVDIDDHQIFGGLGTGETFTLSSNCAIYSSTNDTEGFAEGFQDGSDVINIDAASIVRFDRNGDQSIPNFNGGTFGSIEFSGNGNKYIPFELVGFTFLGVDLTINGDVTRVGGTPIFRFGSIASGNQLTVNHTVMGDWNLATTYTGDNETNSGAVNPTITFAGADQNISSSDFGSVVFAGTGTKTLTGTLLIDADLTINDGVNVNAGAEAIDIAGNWTENGTGTFTQTGSITDFNGGGNQAITQTANSTFNFVDITNNTTVDINSTVQIGGDLDIENGSSVDIEGQVLRVGRDIRVNSTATITYTTPSTSIIVMDGDTEQDLRNINAAQNFPTMQFEGVGNKEIANNVLTVEGDLTIAAESTFQGNSFEINFLGTNWINNGNFNHNNSVNFLNAGNTTNVSTSTFHDIEIGRNDGSIVTTVLLNGNISLNGELNIFANTTLDASASNFSITVEEDWNNYGVFNARAGLVTFTGNSSDFRTQSAVANSGAQADKAFYDLTVNLRSDQFFVVQQDNMLLNDQIDIINDLNILSGDFRLQENSPAQQMNIGGDFVIDGGAISYRNEDSKITMNGTSGTHSINLGSDQVRDFEINAPGATYLLTGDFLIRDDNDNTFEMTAGTLDLNGNIMTINRGGMDMTGGTLIVDEGASLLLNDVAANPDFNKTGGTLQIVGDATLPATLSGVDAGGFTFTQTGGDLQAQYYTIANTTGDGIRIEGGTIDVGGTGNNFSNGSFTSGTGTAYLTLANIAIGTVSASNVIFNAGPSNNVAIDLANQPASGSIEFVIAGGSLAGVQDELDNPDGGATTGFIRWSEDAGLTWIGGTSSVWNVAANWSNGSGDADGIPDADDIIYIESGAPNDPIIAAGESFEVARVTVRNSGNLAFQGTGQLSVGGNFTIFSGATVDMTDDAASRLNVAGAWASAGNFNEGNATVTFNGTSGTHSITTSGNGDPFYNLTIDGAGATYTLGAIMTVANSFQLLDGIFDASSGFEIFINNDWLVSGGIFEPGFGRVRFNGTSGTQNISGGTLWDVWFEGTALKSINGNISIADDVNFIDGGGVVSANDRTIFIGGDWDLDQSDGFDPGTGTVIFNGTGTQNIEANDGAFQFPLTFNDVIFQNAGQKNLFFTMTINGDMSIVSENALVDMEIGATAAIAGTLTQTGGNFRIFNSNFPAAGAYSFTGGEVDFLQDGSISIPGGIIFNDLEIRALSNTTTTATLGGNITVNDDINFSYGEVTFDVNGHTVTLGDYLSLTDNETLIWGAGGTLIHTGAFWNMDVDFNTTDRAFENLILGGTSIKRLNSDIAVGGNLTILDGVELEQLTRSLTNDGDGTLTMEQNAVLDNRVVGVAFPTGFAAYTLAETSRVDLQASGNQTLFTNSGALQYGGLRIFSTGTITLDGNLMVQGDFDMNNSPTLVDGGFDITFNGSVSDIQDYVPTGGTTVTFSRNGDQSIQDNDGSGNDLQFSNLVFGGSGTKTFNPNGGDEVTDIDGDVTIGAGVLATTSRGIDFSGANWTNNGTFNLTVTSRPFVFSGSGATVDPGINDIAAMTVANTSGTVVIQNNGLNLGTGTFMINANGAIDFSNLSHTLACINFSVDAAASWILTGSTLDFDRNSTQFIPVIDEANANITGIPSILTSNAGSKILTGNIVVEDVTIGGSTNLDVNNSDNYQMTINGSWNNSGGNFFEREGTVIFNATNADPKTIEPDGDDFARLIFQGTAVRTYTLQSDMRVDGNTSGEGLTLTSATLDLNGNTLTLGDNDPDDPDAEQNIIGLNGTLEVDGGATLQFDTNDDGGDVADTEIGGDLDVQSGGVLSVVGTVSNLATVTRSGGGDRVDINIESGGEIAARYYTFQYLTDEGLEVEDGATINATNNFSDGSFSRLATDAGDGSGGDDNPVTGNRYLTFESDAALTINNVTFNFDRTPVVGRHYNVTRSNDPSNNTITFTNSSGPLGRVGATYEEDGAGGSPAETTGQLQWDVPDDTQWIGAVSIAWDDAANWDNGVPSIATNNREAIVHMGNPFNPTIDAAIGNVNISGLIIDDGILKIVDNGVLDLDGDFVLGDGSAGTLIMDNLSALSVEGSWTTIANAIFDNGEGGVTFDAPSGATVSITPGDQSFHDLTFSSAIAAGEFNIVSGALDINGDLTITNSATVIPATNGYNYTIAGDIVATNGNFDTAIDGEIILDGSDQTMTDMIFDELTASGTGTKTTVGTSLVNDHFIIESGVTVSGGGPISFAGDVTINGTFNGVTSQTYTFSGDDWIAGPGTYTGLGTIDFNRSGGTQYIRQTTAGNNPVEFHHLIFSGTSQIQLGRLIGGDQYDGNVNLTGDLTANSSINTLDVNNYLIDNTSGTGTFTLDDNERIRVEGADNFPSNFATYALDAGSFTFYYGTIDQTIRGDVTYGNLYTLNSTTKTLGGNVDIDGDLQFLGATIDASTNNYSINLAGRWDTSNGNNDGSFIARSGTITFDGDGTQFLDIGETGTQAFNDVLVNKSGGNVELATNNLTIAGNINVFNGTFDINNLTTSIGGNMGASGTGVYASGGSGLYLLNAISGTPTIGVNGSVINGSMEINAPGRNYELVDNLTLLANFTLTAGTLDINGQRMNLGDAEDAVDIFGTLNVSTTSKPGGTLALGNDVQLVVQPGGTINIVGTPSQQATVTSTGSTDYIFSVTGEVGNNGNIAARYYLIENMGVDGIFINANTTIDATNNFSDGTFQNGFSGGKYLRIENDQDLIGANRIENIVFDDNPGAGATNIFKATSSAGNIELFNYTGGFSGEAFDEDPNDLITWLDPPVVVWTGTVSNDWFTGGNWDSGVVPTAAQDVLIPQTLNEPIITDNAGVAVADDLTIQVNAVMEINTTDADVDLQIGGNLVFEASGRFESSGSDDVIEIGGSWTRLSTALFTAGSSDVTFNSAVGTETIDNNDGFYDLTINVVGTTLLSTDLTVSNDFTVTSGTFDLSTYDLTVSGDFSNNGNINAGIQTVFLIPANTSTKTFNLGTSELYNLTIGESAGNLAEYDLLSDLSLNHDFNLITGVLDPNGNNLNFGNNDGLQDDINLSGTLLVSGGETMALGDDAIVRVQSGGDVRFIGTISSNATLTRRTTGSYDFIVESGGTFEAGYFVVEFIEDEGIWFQSGAILTGLDDGIFTNGSNATQYLRFSNAFASDLTATNITFNAGPASNVRRNEGAGNNIIFEDASGVLAGSTYEIDDGDASTGEVRWTFTNPLRVWVGTISTRWDDNDNWEDESGVSPATFPTSANTVRIPDVTAGSGRYPVIDATSGDESANSVTIFANAQLTVDDNQTLTVANEVTNSGVITIPGTTTGSIDVGDSWTNTGTFNPGNSTVTLMSDADVTVSGGMSFWNLVINGSTPTVRFASSAALDVNNDFTITQGIYEVTDAAHILTVGNDFVVDGDNASFIDNLSVVTFDGADQNIGSALETATLSFNEVVIAGTGTKTLEDVLDINDDLSINTGTTLALGSQSVTFSGNSLDVDGALDVSGGTSTFTFDGNQVQVLTGNVGAITFDNFAINNTAVGNNDVQLNIDVNVNINADFGTGVVQSSGSNPLTFEDNATVSYDGIAENQPTGISSDGNSYAVGPVVKVGDEPFIFPIGEGSRHARIGISNIVGGTATDRYSAEYFFGNNANSSDTKNGSIVRVSGLEYWDISNLNAHSGQPQVTLFWDGASEVTSLSSLLVAHYNGASWDDEGNGGTTGNETAGTITSANNFTSFSPITLATNNDLVNPLPVELLTFSGRSENNTVVLDWSTASELNNDYFEVQKSRDGETFETIGTVKGNGTTDQITGYTFTDISPGHGANYYRLKQVDFDGAEEYHPTILVSHEVYQVGIEASVYPNPATPSNLNVHVLSGDDFNPIRIRVLNLSGELYHEEFHQATLNLRTKINIAAQIEPGLYFVIVEQGAASTKKKLIIR